MSSNTEVERACGSTGLFFQKKSLRHTHFFFVHHLFDVEALLFMLTSLVPLVGRGMPMSACWHPQGIFTCCLFFLDVLYSIHTPQCPLLEPPPYSECLLIFDLLLSLFRSNCPCLSITSGEVWPALPLFPLSTAPLETPSFCLINAEPSQRPPFDMTK